MPAPFAPPEEPVLPLQDIQGIAVPGFFKPHQTLIAVSCETTDDAVRKFKSFLLELADDVTTGADALQNRRLFRLGRREKKVLLAVAFTNSGVSKLTPGAASIPSDAFQLGLSVRSKLLGDPTDLNEEGNPANWVVGGVQNPFDALIILAGDERDDVDKAAKGLQKQLKKAELKLVYSEDGDVRPDLPGHEHFGFEDGVSQPGIRGRASDDPDDYITARHVAKSQSPEHSLFGFPGQDLVWSGVLILGHPATSPDPLIPGLPSPAVPEWTRNGSYLVFRRLRQDVGLFWRTMAAEAERLAKLPGFEEFTDESLAARIVGRWQSGAPVNRTPSKDDPKLGADRMANNNFRFDSDGFAMPLANGETDEFPHSKADPAGITCPWAAHIRKVNTRDSGSDIGGRDATYARRLLRVGVPFGTPLADRYATQDNDPEKGNRGLLFLSIQASIEDQFEFLSARWMNDPSRPKEPGGHDILLGQNSAAGEDRVRRCAIFGAGAQQNTVQTNAQWIVPTGGGYMFVPSLTALKEVLAQ
ncbi:MAG: Dyp-type peroxidase [Pirellulales bacterium]